MPLRAFSIEDGNLGSKTILTSRTKVSKDIDLSFAKKPSGDVFKKTDAAAVKQAVKNLLLTNFSEKPFLPRFGGNLNSLLFALNTDIDDEDFCSYLMYPKVFQDYLTHHSKYGPVRCLPTNVFFYGMENSQEISVEIDPGKILEIRLQAVSEVNDEGDRKVFFELNGQPRIIRIPDHNTSTTKLKQKPKAETNNPKHLAAPMPGAIASIAVKEGDLVKKGDVLLTIEAMKMETVLNAENDFRIKKIYTTIGSQIDAKDLLIEFD